MTGPRTSVDRSLYCGRLQPSLAIILTMTLR